MTELSVAAALRRLVDKDPGRPALTCAGRTVTRDQIDRHSNRVARCYAALGVGSGEFVALVLHNSVELVAAALAVSKLGATCLPLSPNTPAPELLGILERAKPSLVVGIPDGTFPEFRSIAVGAPYVDYSDAPLPEATAAQWYATASGGSTGRPKIIINTSPGVLDVDAPMFQMRHDGVVLITGPLYHGGPFAYGARAMLWGNHVVLVDRFDAAQTLALVERHRVEYMLAVPTVIHRIARLDDAMWRQHDLSSLRSVVMMGAACPIWLKNEWIHRLGADAVHEFYSCTERLGVTWITGTESLQRPGSVGRPVQGSRVRIIDAQGAELPAGEIGEIFMMPSTGPGSTYRYIGAEPRRRDDGWESCGDLGWLDTDGYLYIADRRTDMIVTGGANVYPAEVEAVLEAYPGVRAAAVIGLPDDDLGQRVHAIVETGSTLDVDALRAFLEERLVRYKIPRSIESVAYPLRNEAGKMSRSALRAERTAAATRT